MSAIDRSQPIYRLFDMEDGSRQWWTIGVDGFICVRLSDIFAAKVEAWLDTRPWRDAFYAAFEANRKATIYGSTT